MEWIGAFEAKTKLGELLDRAAKGESFTITKHGRPVGRLIPPEGARDEAAIAAAVERLKSFRGMLKGMNRDEMLGLKHEGHDR